MTARSFCGAGLATVLFAGSASAAGPAAMARPNRSLWPQPIASVADFDLASRAEILSFAAAVADRQGLDAGTLARVLGIKGVSLESADAWHEITLARLAENYRLASAHCQAADWLCEPQMTPAALTGRAAAMESELPQAFRAWREDARAFHHAYADEQLRLAALFPHPTSEIRGLSENERNGFELADRRFLLTFDDGPSPKGGASDRLIDVLREAGRNGVFFLLGERLAARRSQQPADALREDYSGMCVASHGWSHRSHQAWPEWQNSVIDSAKSTEQAFGSLYRPLFRPPYGQRKTDSDTFFTQQGMGVALWNIDSQDWSSQLTSADVRGRVVSLMLLWRRGVILFHDVHDKAREALPNLWSDTNGAGVVWMDCRRYPEN
jgi:peptidoglycan-N-acetylglucosamine deacetylase